MLTDGYFFGGGCGDWGGVNSPVLWCVKGLNKSFKRLAGAAGIGLSTAAIVNFGKKSVQAFIADAHNVIEANSAMQCYKTIRARGC